jgi:adenosylhomocysteine nucleosidase
MPEEARQFRRLARSLRDVGILLTGIGKRNTGNSIQAALSAGSPRLVLSCGFAGALRPDLPRGSVVYHTDPDSPLISVLQNAGAIPAQFLCVDHVLTTAAEKRAAWQSSGADAVEMESAVIRAVCRERGIPSATVRVISDAATDDLPLDFNRLTTPDQQMDYRKLACALVKSPGKIRGLLKLQRHCRAASEALAQVLAKIVPAVS